MVSLSPVGTRSSVGTYVYDGPRGYQVLSCDDSNLHVPVSAVRFLLSAQGPAVQGWAVVVRGQKQVASGARFCTQPDAQGKLEWVESDFDGVFALQAEDVVLLAMEKGAKTSFVYALSNPALRDVGCGISVRGVDGFDGQENRYGLFLELLVRAGPNEIIAMGTPSAHSTSFTLPYLAGKH